MKVSNFKVKNQFIIKNKDFIIFQSYESTICKIEDKKITIYDDFDYSRTTSKYLRLFLEEYAKYNILDFIKKNDIRKNKKLEYKGFTIVYSSSF